MSLILDALKKADNERREDDQGPSIGSRHTEFEQVIEPKKSESSSKTPVVTAVTVTALIFIIAVFFFWPESSTIQVPTKEPVIATAKKVELQSTQPPIATEKAKTQSGSELVESKPSAIRKQLIEAQYREAQKREALEAEQEKAASVEKSEGSISTLYSEEKPSEAPSMANSTSKKAASKQPVSDLYAEADTSKQSLSSTNSLGAYGNIKLIKELPFNVQSDIPTLIYSKHVFKGEGSSANNIVINDKVIRENNRFESGIVVVKILKDGVLLKKGQHSFKMKARNSWLNY